MASVFREVTRNLTRHADDRAADGVYGCHREPERPADAMSENLFEEALFNAVTEPWIPPLEFAVALSTASTSVAWARWARWRHSTPSR
jgi:hypothetical protein